MSPSAKNKLVVALENKRQELLLWMHIQAQVYQLEVLPGETPSGEHRR